MDSPVPLRNKLSGQDEEYVRRHVQVKHAFRVMFHPSILSHLTLTTIFQFQGKLEILLPTATDSVLCDYVLVMVGNKKTRCQIANDLEVKNFITMMLVSFSSIVECISESQSLPRHFLEIKRARILLSGFGSC